MYFVHHDAALVPATTAPGVPFHPKLVPCPRASRSCGGNRCKMGLRANQQRCGGWRMAGSVLYKSKPIRSLRI